MHRRGESQEGSFAASVRGERARPESSLADGLAAVKVMNAAYAIPFTATKRCICKRASPLQ